MSVKVNGKKLHLTTFEVPTTGENIRKCLVAQIDLAKAEKVFDNFYQKTEKLTDDEDVDIDSVIGVYDARIKLIDTYSEFLKSILKLSADQVKKVENSDFDDVVDLAREVIEKVLGFNSDKSTETESK